MSTHSIAELQANPRDLIDRASKGEAVTIMDEGKVVATLSAPPGEPKGVTDADWDWLAKRRAGRGRSPVDAGTLVSQMRDEEWTR